MTDKEIHDFLSKAVHDEPIEDDKKGNIINSNNNSNVNSELNINTKNDITNSNRVGLVLNGGGGKGAYQLGVLKALLENDMLKNITDVSGASIGAINAALYAMDDIDLMYKAWSDINMLTLFDVDLSMLKQNKAYFSRQEMLKLVDKYIDYNKIRNQKLGIYISICKVEGENKVAEYRKLNEYSDDKIKDILLASSALPIIYEPVNIDGNSYIDGGVVDNEPIKPLYDLGIRQFIVIGMKHGKILNEAKWPGASFISIYPSANIGEFIDGTIDFREKSVQFRQMLGYKDGLRAIKTKFVKDPMYINLETVLAQNDLNEIKMQLRTDFKAKEISTSINSNIDKFNEIANKYDI